VGEKVYFNTMATGGSMSKLINVPIAATTPLPDGLDPVKAAALLNPVMSSWMTPKARTTNLLANFAVVILGATSASGNAANSIAQTFGAGRVIGVARNAASLEELELDDRIVLKDLVTETDFSSLVDINVILDLVYGPAMVHLISSLKSRVPTQYVDVGAMSQLVAELPGAVLRSKNITIRGAGPGAWSMGVLKGGLPEVLEALRDIKERNIKVVKLEDVEKVWGQSGDRIVFVP
jgi:NADPH:quinone reductase-like Zn-dependent oxidoreductase